MERLLESRRQASLPSPTPVQAGTGDEVRLAVAIARGASGREPAAPATAALPTSPAPVAGLPRQDLLDTLTHALARDGVLLTAGERFVIGQLQGARPASQALYARLLSRVPGVFFIEELSYPEVSDPAAAADELIDRGLAGAFDRRARPADLAGASTAGRLREVCRTLGRPVSGPRDVLVSRCSDDAAGHLLRRPALELRHRRLFRAVLRLALLDGRGRLDRLVLARLGHRAPAAYTPTHGAGVFPQRAAWLRHERGLTLRRNPGALPPDALFEWLEAIPLAPAWRQHLSGRRYAEDALHEVLRHEERTLPAHEAVQRWRRVLDAGLVSPGRAVARLALALGRSGSPAEGVALCEAWMERLPPHESRALETTARRLGRQSGQGHRPLPPLRDAGQRQITLAQGSRHGARPRYRVGGVERTIEAAVVAWLAEHGRLALHGEASPWSSLFGILFREVLFAPVAGMLPGPMLRAPLDLGTPGFRERRAGLVTQTLARIRNGEGATIIRATLRRRGREDIRGVHWHRVPPDVLVGLARLLPGPVLATIMETFVDDWRGARRGLPDLLVLPGRSIRLAAARPAHLPTGLLLVEVKGPGDTLRAGQRVWIDRLLAAGIPTEVWRVCPGS